MEETAGDASLADVVVVDLNDPNLLLAEFDTNSDIDPYAAPPPVADGTYLVKIKQIDVKGPNGELVRHTVRTGTGENAKAYAFTALEARIIDPGAPFDNFVVFDRFVSTLPARNGGVPIVRILTCLGVQLPARINAKILLDAFFNAVASEPELRIETEWEGSVSKEDADKLYAAGVDKKKFPRVYGMRKFPQDSKGNPIPEIVVDSPIGKLELRANVRITGYFPKA